LPASWYIDAIMAGRVRLSATRLLTVAIALLVCGGLIIESPLLGDARSAADAWPDPGADVRVPRLADTVLVRGVVRSTLHDALHRGGARALPYGARAELSWRLADIFEYRVDMSRDLEPGDELRVLVERALRPDGSTYRIELLAARLTVSGSPIEAVKHQRGAYVDRWGRSLRATFLRAPLSFRRMSSPFGVRWHPIRGGWREHRGIDYAAAAGTPVRSVGDGVVIFAGRRGSYGNLVEVAHSGGVVTRYAHLRGYGRRTWRGARVRVGQTVGYVGSTGLSTGPHLHFEMLVNGRYTDPRHGLAARARAPRPRYANHPVVAGNRAALLAALGS
jgi:murein DD-endopeptidase MepM/ murein hydrolase activator NlpD